MKKILFTLIVFLAAANMVAQEHLTFKGIPIEGSLREFSQKLKAKGFTLVGKENNIAMFSGEFTGRDVNIGVTATSDEKKVFSLVVFFDPSGEWKSLVNDYSYYKDLYTRKYGEPAFSKEYNPALSDSNTALMAEVYHGTIEYKSTWFLAGSGSSIHLSIDKTSGIYEGWVVIGYYNSTNAESKFQSDLNDI